MSSDDDTIWYRSADFVATRSLSCAIPGYLIAEPVDPVESIAELPPDRAARLGPTLGSLSAAIRRATGADRVYCLLFAEEKRAIHFHLFPRAAWLLEAYREHLGPGAAVSAPQLFEWARFAYADDSDLPAGVDPWATVGPRLHAELRHET